MSEVNLTPAIITPNRLTWARFRSGKDDPGRPPAAVLFERPGLSGNSQPKQASGTSFVSGTRKSLANCLGTSPTGGLDSMNIVAPTCTTVGPRACDPDKSPLIAFDTAQITSPHNRSNPKPGDPAPTLISRGSQVAIARTVRARADSGGDSSRDTWVDTHSGVRKLTPMEFERLQGFPDGWTDIPGASDTARYKAVGNAFPVPLLRWIGHRIQMVENIINGR